MGCDPDSPSMMSGSGRSSGQTRVTSRDACSMTRWDMAKPVSQKLLNIEDKTRSNLFAWRGQFSPQLIEALLDAYCPSDSVILDPFAGSGTVLHEAAAMQCPVFGYEINPSAWAFCKLYEFANMCSKNREDVISELQRAIDLEFPVAIFLKDERPIDDLEQTTIRIGNSLSDRAKILFNALIVVLDVYNNRVTSGLVHSKLSGLTTLVRQLPYSDRRIKADLQDARALPLRDRSVDFVITSPPYINVFNYHQNYRRSVEILGWNLLRVARSEIGSNRANRQNRFYTVVQYCIDMSAVMLELSRVLRPDGRVILVIGHESKVLGVPFNNTAIVENIIAGCNLFEIVLRQQRVFTNRFGQLIREDILNLRRTSREHSDEPVTSLGRSAAAEALYCAQTTVPDRDHKLLIEAISRVDRIPGTPIFDSLSYGNYQNRKNVMMVKENKERFMSNDHPMFPTPHLHKLNALLRNPRLPQADYSRVQEALHRYREWIKDLENVSQGDGEAVSKLVDATNRYKDFVELDLIFDSPEDFLYRQKGQLKLDNTILEEFLPQLLYRGLRLPDSSFDLGPRKTYAGLSFMSSITSPGKGGHPTLRSKNQDFVLGKRLYMMTSFDRDFHDADHMESYLGYVCVECKTNLDKTMFQEGVATSRDLKIAVPSSLYFLVCEFLDMTPLSTVSTHIDDILIARKAKRMSSNVRQRYRSAGERRRYRDEYVEFLITSKYYSDVFQRMIDKVQRAVDDTDPDTDDVLKRGHF